MSKIKMLGIFILVLLVIFFCFVIYLFLGDAPKIENPIFGVVFSQKHSRDLGLNWRSNYLAILDDLGVKELKIITHWDLIEPEENRFDFKDLDWQLVEAEKREVNVMLVIGMKTGRWPECHIPSWAKDLSKEKQQEVVLRLVQMITTRYKESIPITSWSVENEPLFTFGDCPWKDKGFVKKEIEMVRSVDSYYKRPIVITDSGEGSFWIEAAKLGDIVGITIYKNVWMSNLNKYFTYQYPPFYYWVKSEIVKNFFNKEVVCSELQAEPWCPNLLYDCSLDEQRKTMNIDKFRENVNFAKQTGLSKFYLWGTEWWYWMKEDQGQAQIWEEAKKLF